MSALARTPVYRDHIELGGRMVPFAGFDMPIQYPNGVLNEYHAVRDGGAGLFDISHMGQIRISGKDTLAFLQYVTSNDVAALAQGQVQYSALLNKAGTFIDDITTYRISAREYYLCVNAANRIKDVAHLQQQAKPFNVVIADESDATALLALQGEKSGTLLQAMVNIDLAEIAYYHFAQVEILGSRALVSRTGYTGEDGFELYLPGTACPVVWRALLEAGAHPIGLAARDMLRVEMGYALYGHEINDSVTPVEANLMWITRVEKGDFLGKNAVVSRRSEGAKKKLIGLKLAERGVPREHYPVTVDGRIIGEITSGIHSPLSGCGIAMAYVAADYDQNGRIAVLIRGRATAAARVKPPFVRSNVRR